MCRVYWRHDSQGIPVKRANIQILKNACVIADTYFQLVMGLPLGWVLLTTGTYRIATNAFMLETPSYILGHPNETVFA